MTNSEKMQIPWQEGELAFVRFVKGTGIILSVAGTWFGLSPIAYAGMAMLALSAIHTWNWVERAGSGSDD